jgi:hypothetical protein
MAPSRCLPERAVLESLVTGAGVRGRRPTTSAPPPVEAVRFSELPERRPVEAPSAPPRARAPGRALAPAPASAQAAAAAPALSPSALAEVEPLEEIFGPATEAAGMEQRLERFVTWLMRRWSASAAFVADLEGLPLVNRGTAEAYIVAISPLARAQAEIARFVPNSPPGTSVVELDHQKVLQVVWADTRVGRVGVGLVLPEPLPHAVASRIRRIAALAVIPRGET